MKCANCGVELESGVLFCRECGTKVEAEKKLFCRDCGAELTEGSKFCSKCGSKVLGPDTVDCDGENSTISGESSKTEENSIPVAENDTAPDNSVNAIPSTVEAATLGKLTVGDKLKAKIVDIWKQMCFFSKMATIGAVLSGLLTIVAICTGKVLPIVVSVLQIAAIVVAILGHKGKISFKAAWLKYLILVVAILLSVANVASYSVGKNNTKQPTGSHSMTESQDKDTESTPTDTVSSTAFLPIGSTDYSGKDYSAVVKQFNDAGFEKISVEKVEDLDSHQQDLIDTIVDISINGNNEFSQGQEVEKTASIMVRYHAFAKCNVNMNINFVPNLLFSKYDVKLKLDGAEQAVLEHGVDKEMEFSLYPGNYTFTFEKKDSSSVNGTITLDVKGEINIGLQINCYNDKITIDTIFLEDIGALEEGQVMVSKDASDFKQNSHSDIADAFESLGFTNITLKPVYDVSAESSDIGIAIEISIGGKTDYKRGDIFSSDVPVVITYHEDEEKDPEKIAAAETMAALEKNLPKEMAKRTVIVAMTNCQAVDVFAPDGNTFDPDKFHSYADIDDFFMTVEREGEWTALDENTWHVKDMVLRIYNYNTYLKASGNVKLDGENFIFFNVDRYVATKDYIDSTDPSETNVEHFEPSDFNSFLTVPASLISEDRDVVAAQEKMNAEEERQKWIEGQFNWWDGRHEALSELIKDNLNDSKSFKHVDASYIDVCDEDRQQTVNNTLRESGFSERVEIGDLFVMEEFTAKNAFNATIKSTGYGIVRSSGTVILLGIA